MVFGHIVFEATNTHIQTQKNAIWYFTKCSEKGYVLFVEIVSPLFSTCACFFCAEPDTRDRNWDGKSCIFCQSLILLCRKIPFLKHGQWVQKWWYLRGFDVMQRQGIKQPLMSG